MKKLVSLLLAVIMTLSVTLSVSAAPVQQQESVANEISLELSVQDLKNGVTVVIEDDGSGEYVARQLSSEETADIENGKLLERKIVAEFHCGITYHKSTQSAHLHWNATGEQLTRVQARVFCKPTSIFATNYYYNDDIDGYSDLNGRYNYASGITEDFEIPSDGEKVNVGWKSAYITTVKDGKLSMASASQTVTL